MAMEHNLQQGLHVNNDTGTTALTSIGRGAIELVSNEVRDIIVLMNDLAFTLPISLLGAFTNIANVIVFSKKGFSESSNFNFLTLSVFDFLVSVISFVARLLLIPLFRPFSFEPMFRRIGQTVSHAMIVGICGSAMMTTLIAVERCVCVVFPLKVKTLLSRQRSLFLMVTIVLYHAIFLIVLYVDTGPPYDAFPQKLDFYYFSMYVIPSTTCFFIVVFTTVVLVIHLRRHQQWRRETASNFGSTSDKDDKLVRTIIAISTLFIICAFPTAAVFVTQFIYPPFRYTNLFLKNLLLIMFNIGGFFQAVSSSMNIFFYYQMSSRFKKVVRSYLAVCMKKQAFKEQDNPNSF